MPSASQSNPKSKSVPRKILPRKTWDIFCRVIDNYGDIGVCWRLAKQLSTEHPINVRLWVDDIAALQLINPKALKQDSQQLDGVEVRVWSDNLTSDKLGNNWVADVIIEAFACNLPEFYIQQMATNATQGIAPRWINLDYLSAEHWVEECHQLDSFHPATQLTKQFFFPGFTAKTGGLIRESALTQNMRQFKQDGDAQQKLIYKLGLTNKPNGLLVSLFCYENQSLANLLEAWQKSSVPITCLISHGKSLNAINALLKSPLSIGDSCVMQQLTLHAIPFVSQFEYDQLLWLCDVNLVRGEDSFVRAQWAEKPMLWQIYPQQDDTHLIKLNAFLEHYLKLAPATVKPHLESLFLKWNQGSELSDEWDTLVSNYEQWQKITKKWGEMQQAHGDLVNNLVQFAQNGF